MKIMSTPYHDFLFLNQTFDPQTHLFAKYYLETDGDFLTVAGGIAAESSIGTWTKLSTQKAETFQKYCAKVYFADPKKGIIQIAYPIDLFEPGNLPQLLSSIAGNIYGLKEVKKLKLLNLEFPEIYVRSFPGPQIGLKGIKEITGVADRPLIGTIIKPKEGLSSQEHTEVAMETYRGGVDLVKDDENLTSPAFNLFSDRVNYLTDSMKEAGFLGKDNPLTGGEKIYAFNITASSEIMKERAELVKQKGGNCIMVDILTCGFSGVQFIRNQNYGLIIHGHRAMHAALTRDPHHGLTMLVIAKLARLAGIDSLHTGTIVGKMEGGAKEILEINKFLTSEWYDLKKVLPVASGGLSPLDVPELYKYFGNDILLNFGGGIHGHPEGSKIGAQAVKQAVEGVTRGQSLEDYSQTHDALKIALEHWRKKV